MFKAISIIFIFYSAIAYAEGEFHLNNDFSINYNSISGAGKANSSLTEGWNYLNVLGINGSGVSKDWNYYYNIGIKATDDERNDIKKVSLSNLNGSFKKGANSFVLGDIFETFSQYTLGTSLKGASYKYQPVENKKTEFTSVFGYAYPRWDSLWKEPLTRTIKRQAYGARVKQNFSNDFSVGVNYIKVDDTDRVTAMDALYDSYNAGLDLSYIPMPGLSINGEYAMSDYDEKTSKTSDTGKAFKAEIVGDADPSKVAIEYEEVSPDFFSALGSAVPDRRKIKTKWRYKYTKFTTFNTGLLWYRNNLNNKGNTTYTWRPELSMSVKKIFKSRPYSFADFSYKFDRKYGSGSSQADHYFNINYRDNFNGADSDTNLGYTIYKTETSVRDSSEITFNTSLSKRYEKEKVIYTPVISLGGWYSKDELSNFTDKIYEYSFGLGYERPDSNITADLRTGQNFVRKEDPTSDDSQKLFAALGIYYRTKIAKSNSLIFLKLNYNNYDFSTNSKDFRENSLNFGVNISF